MKISIRLSLHTATVPMVENYHYDIKDTYVKYKGLKNV